MSEPALLDRPLRVVFVPPNAWAGPRCAHALLQQEDAEKINTTLAHLARMGVDWEVIVPTARPWNVLDRGNPFWRGVDPWRTLRILLAHRKADVVVPVFEGSGLLLTLLRRLFFFRPGIVLWDASPGNPWRVIQLAQRLSFSRYDGFMMLTSSQKQSLEADPRVASPVQVIGYNVDETFFTPQPDAGEKYILAVGDDLSRDYVTLLAALADRSEPVVLKTRWRPTQGQAPAQVKFISDRLDLPAFRSLYADASMIVLPLHKVASAGGVTGLFEAMAMGKPVIVTQSSLTEDFVTDGEDALVVPPGDAGAMAHAIDRLANDAALRRQLGQAARRRIEAQLSTAALAARMKRFLESVAGKAGPR